MAMRLGVREWERGGVARVLGQSPLFLVPGPTACVRSGGHLAPTSSREQGQGRECAGPARRPLLVLRYQARG